MTVLPIWPAGLMGYKRTPEFSETTVPAGLLRDHATKDGVWARLHVLTGQLRFVDQEGGGETLLSPGVHEVIFPGRLHHVAPVGEVRFLVEFCRAGDGISPGADPDAPQALPHR